MAASQITWEQFSKVNQTAQGVRLKFEDLCRQLFLMSFFLIIRSTGIYIAIQIILDLSLILYMTSIISVI